MLEWHFYVYPVMSNVIVTHMFAMLCHRTNIIHLKNKWKYYII